MDKGQTAVCSFSCFKIAEPKVDHDGEDGSQQDLHINTCCNKEPVSLLDTNLVLMQIDLISKEEGTEASLCH